MITSPLPQLCPSPSYFSFREYLTELPRPVQTCFVTQTSPEVMTVPPQSLSERARTIGSDFLSLYSVASSSPNSPSSSLSLPSAGLGHTQPCLPTTGCFLSRKVGTAAVPLRGLLVKIKLTQDPKCTALLLAGVSHRSPPQPWQAQPVISNQERFGDFPGLSTNCLVARWSLE